LLVLIIVSNIGFSYKLERMLLFGDSSYDGIIKEVEKIFSGNNKELIALEYKRIGEILSQEPNIENKYVMSVDFNYPYYSNSKFLFTTFTEGEDTDSLNEFISRKNWSEIEIAYSNNNSVPDDRYDKYKPIADYLVYTEAHEERVSEHLKILRDPNHPEIPQNFEVLYISNQTGVVVYRINH